MSDVPRIRCPNPESAWFKMEYILAPPDGLLSTADLAQCTYTAERIGWLKSEVTIRGTEAQLQRFVDLAWQSLDAWAASFRNEMRKAARK